MTRKILAFLAVFTFTLTVDCYWTPPPAAAGRQYQLTGTLDLNPGTDIVDVDWQYTTAQQVRTIRNNGAYG